MSTPNKLTCAQVGTLLTFYLDNNISPQLKAFIEAHFAVCPSCRAKFDALKSMIEDIRGANEELKKNELLNSKKQNEYDLIQSDISAYIDNELDDDANIRVKKYIISNPKAREELEKMYNLRNIILNSFEKTKNEAKFDFSKNIMRKINLHEEIYANDDFGKIMLIFATLFIFLSVTALLILGV